jgi:hypothetical protein
LNGHSDSSSTAAAAASTAQQSKAPAATKTATSSRTAFDPRVKAAVKVQALYRGFSLRNQWAREDAAILLQAVFRGYKARVLLSQIIEQMILDGEL